MKDLEPIIVRGAREHNLKDISLEIPSLKFVVITGPSGSGKSSLAFDTVFAEGQRRYLESLSSYARQFMEQLSKPDVDFVDGLSPAVAIDQKTISSHPRSTVGTVTDIYDFMRLLYARRGVVLDSKSGETLKAFSDQDIIENLLASKEEKIQLFASVVRGRKGEYLKEFEQWRRAGFTKVLIDGKLHSLYDPILISRHQHHDIDIYIDVIYPAKLESAGRIQEALKVCDKFSEGWLRVLFPKEDKSRLFSKRLASSSGESFPDLEPRLFSFNSPHGACPDCKGLGIVEVDTLDDSKDDDDQGDFDFIESFEDCPSCKGARLKKESLSVIFGGKNIAELSNLSCLELQEFFQQLPDEERLHPVTTRIVDEVQSRLKFLDNVGVAYLSLGRRTSTLSGGEAQRIRLATQLGCELSGVLYVLDEPSIGLHPSDHRKLIRSLHKLRDLGNSVLCVEHDEETMLASDYIIDIGPGSGKNGGHVCEQGTPEFFVKDGRSLTAKYLRNELKVSEERSARPGNGKSILLKNCIGHNLRDVSLDLPLGKLVVFTGVSGSGKSSLVRDTLEAALIKKLYRGKGTVLPFKELIGIDHIDKVVHVDQRPIGRSPRSNPATYTGLFTPLRQVFAATPDAQIRGYTASTFSFNIKGGRCDACEGAGRKKIEMHFLPDVYVPCETCMGSRYRREVLEVRFKGKNISDALNMPIEEAWKLFENQPMLEPKLRTLMDVGLGYIQLGQSSTTLSGGEAQRIKLAKELSKRSTGKTIYFLDEPTTGLHFDDVKKLLLLCQRLVDQGNSVIIIEHNMDVICSADWIVDMGPGPGLQGGQIVFEGTPKDMVQFSGASLTQEFVSKTLSRNILNK